MLKLECLQCFTYFVPHLHQEHEKRNPKLHSFLRGAESRPEVGCRLVSLLIAPIQRVPRYTLLLAEILRHTPHPHPHRQQLQSKNPSPYGYYKGYSYLQLCWVAMLLNTILVVTTLLKNKLPVAVCRSFFRDTNNKAHHFSLFSSCCDYFYFISIACGHLLFLVSYKQPLICYYF